MSLQSIWTDQAVDVAALSLQPQTPTNVLSCAPISNVGGNYKNSMKLSLRFKNFISGNGAGVGTWWLSTLVEHEVDPVAGRWSTLMTQFAPIRTTNTALERRLEMQPGFDSFNLGIDEIIAPIDNEILRVSREPGAVPEGNLRVCLTVREDDAGGINSLTSFDVDADIELFSV